MKLHLPKGIRTALLACVSSVAAVGTTLATGALVAAAMASQAQAVEGLTEAELPGNNGYGSQELQAGKLYDLDDFNYTAQTDANTGYWVLRLNGEGGTVGLHVGNTYTAENVLHVKAIAPVNSGQTAVKIGAGFLAVDIAASEGGIGNLMIEEGTLSIGFGGGSSLVKGNTTVAAGATLELAAGDALGYRNYDYTDKVILTGSDTATANLVVSNHITMSTSLELNGNTSVSGTGNLDTYGGSITATGKNNTISTTIKFRDRVEIDVIGEQNTLTINGTLEATSGNNDKSDPGLTKTGLGTLIFDNSDSQASQVLTDGLIMNEGSVVNEGTLTINGLTYNGGSIQNNGTLTITGDIEVTGEGLIALASAGGSTVTYSNKETGNGYIGGTYTLISGGTVTLGDGSSSTKEINVGTLTVADGRTTVEVAGTSGTYYINNSATYDESEMDGADALYVASGQTLSFTSGADCKKNVDLAGGTLSIAWGSMNNSDVRSITLHSVDADGDGHISAGEMSSNVVEMSQGTINSKIGGAGNLTLTNSGNGVFYLKSTIEHTGDLTVGSRVDIYDEALLNNTGNVTLNGQNIHIGRLGAKVTGLTLNGGSLTSAGDDWNQDLTLAGATVTFNKGSMNSGKTITLVSEGDTMSENTISMGNSTVSGTITGTGNLVLERNSSGTFIVNSTIEHTGDLTLKGNNDMSVNGTINNTGTLTMGGVTVGTSHIGSNVTGITLAGATLDVEANDAFGKAITVTAASTISGAAKGNSHAGITGGITGTANVTINSAAGEVSGSGHGNYFALGGDINLGTADLIIGSGVVRLGNVNEDTNTDAYSITAGNVVVNSGATLEVVRNGGSLATGLKLSGGKFHLQGSGDSGGTLAFKTLTVDGASASTISSTAWGGSASFTSLSGTGDLNISSSKTITIGKIDGYTGNLTVSGALAVTEGLTIAGNTVTQSGGTLSAPSITMTSGEFVYAGGGISNPNGGNVALSLTGGKVTVAANGFTMGNNMTLGNVTFVSNSYTNESEETAYYAITLGKDGTTTLTGMLTNSGALTLGGALEVSDLANYTGVLQEVAEGQSGYDQTIYTLVKGDNAVSLNVTATTVKVGDKTYDLIKTDDGGLTFAINGDTYHVAKDEDGGINFSDIKDAGNIELTGGTLNVNEAADDLALTVTTSSTINATEDVTISSLTGTADVELTGGATTTVTDMSDYSGNLKVGDSGTLEFTDSVELTGNGITVSEGGTLSVVAENGTVTVGKDAELTVEKNATVTAEEVAVGDSGTMTLKDGALVDSTITGTGTLATEGEVTLSAAADFKGDLALADGSNVVLTQGGKYDATISTAENGTGKITAVAADVTLSNGEIGKGVAYAVSASRAAAGITFNGGGTSGMTLTTGTVNAEGLATSGASITAVAGSTLGNGQTLTIGEGATLVLSYGVNDTPLTLNGTLEFKTGATLDITALGINTGAEGTYQLFNGTASGLTTSMLNITAANGYSIEVTNSGALTITADAEDLRAVVDNALITGYVEGSYAISGNKVLTFALDLDSTTQKLEGAVTVAYQDGTTWVDSASKIASEMGANFESEAGVGITLVDKNGIAFDLADVTSLTINGYDGFSVAGGFASDFTTSAGVLDGTEGKVYGMYYAPSIPEPTTATLSLLALAALAARRRRK